MTGEEAFPNMEWTSPVPRSGPINPRSDREGRGDRDGCRNADVEVMGTGTGARTSEVLSEGGGDKIPKCLQSKIR